MAKIRVLIVDDSLTVRKHLAEVLNSDPELEVIGEAEDGKRAVELCTSLRPDVVALDMMLPVMSGLAATETIMAYCPTPIVIVSASTNRGELFRTYDALAAGALDVIEKPAGDEFDRDWERNFIATVKLLSRIKVITHPRARLRDRGTSVPAACSPVLPAGPTGIRYAALGASTGGPGAVLEILRQLPADFPLPIFLVIHISPTFSGALAEWLNAQTRIPVRHAEDGEPLPSHGKTGVLMAPPDRHLTVRGGRVRLTAEPEVHSCRPSVDVLFQSVAHELGGRAVACLLTGMGRDGAAGLLAVRQAGGITLAQDEETSVVFGMPREAILLGAASRVLPLGEIGPALVSLGLVSRT